MYPLHFFQIIVMIFALKMCKKNASKDYHASALSLQKTECQAFFMVVRIGYPHPLTLKGVLLLPHLGPGGRHTRTIIHLRTNPILISEAKSKVPG